MNNAFITGSHAYGILHAKSDIDLCVLMDEQDYKKIRELNGPGAIRFGKLNLVILTDPVRFERWKDTTIELIKQKPVTKETACAAFEINGCHESEYVSGDEDLEERLSEELSSISGLNSKLCFELLFKDLKLIKSSKDTIENLLGMSVTDWKNKRLKELTEAIVLE